jgi:hypothetical protein
MAAFADAIVVKTIWGNKAVTMGTYASSAGAVGGNIDTGLRVCEFIKLTPNSGTVIANASTVNATLPIAGSAVAIVSDANESGYWLAFGDALA